MSTTDRLGALVMFTGITLVMLPAYLLEMSLVNTTIEHLFMISVIIMLSSTAGILFFGNIAIGTMIAGGAIAAVSALVGTLDHLGHLEVLMAVAEINRSEAMSAIALGVTAISVISLAHATPVDEGN